MGASQTTPAVEPTNSKDPPKAAWTIETSTVLLDALRQKAQKEDEDQLQISYHCDPSFQISEHAESQEIPKLKQILVEKSDSNKASRQRLDTSLNENLALRSKVTQPKRHCRESYEALLRCSETSNNCKNFLNKYEECVMAHKE